MDKEAHQRLVKLAAEANHKARLAREAAGHYRSYGMRLTLTDAANDIVKDMSNKEFREFVSEAIRRAKN